MLRPAIRAARSALPTKHSYVSRQAHDAYGAIMSDAQEPLIADPERAEAEADSGTDSFTAHGNTSSALGKRPDATSAGIFVWLLAFSAGISGLLFGCMWLRHLKNTYHFQG
jgi:hypothetical protein